MRSEPPPHHQRCSWESLEWQPEQVMLLHNSISFTVSPMIKAKYVSRKILIFIHITSQVAP